MKKLDGKSFDVIGENISKLKEIFPEVVNGDNQIDFDYLRDILEKDVEVVDIDEEHYKFTWWGKKESKRIALESTTKTLIPSEKDSKNWNSTENIYIEGDNLDALKILLGSYRNRIKMIYIDPPYNTGHDFIYNDKFAQSTEEYYKDSNQLNEEGFLFENAKTDGKYHSNWLNMFYARLLLAKKLLTDDGVIFISIDDNEIMNVRKICDEIFGESNFIAEVSRIATAGSKNDSNLFIKDNDYVLIYSRNINKVRINKLKRENTQSYPKKDEIGEFKLRALEMQGGGEDTLEDRPKMGYSIYYNPISEDYELLHDYDLNNEPVYDNPSVELLNKGYVCIRPKKGQNDSILGRWRWSKEKFLENLSEVFIDVETGRAYTKDRKKEYLESLPSCNIKFLNGEGTKEISKLFGKKVFSFPKPVNLLKYLIYIGSDDDSIIMDFFAGSSTTAHAVMELNSENMSNDKRKFIMVQIAQKTDKKSVAYKEGYENISEISMERIRRAGEKIVEESGDENLDIGFKVFKIDESNFIPWNPNLKTNEEVQQAVLGTANNIIHGRSELDLIYELILLRNLDLNCAIEERVINNNHFYIVNNGFMIVCLQPKIDTSIAEDVIQLKEEYLTDKCQFLILEKALGNDNNVSINISKRLESEGIEFYNI